MILGDFNYPDIDYKKEEHGIGHGTGLEASENLQITSECGLHQHVHDYTRYRADQNPSILDYILTDDEYVIDKLCLTMPLCKSDHVCIDFGYLTNHCTQSPLHQKLDYWKADYESVKERIICD